MTRKTIPIKDRFESKILKGAYTTCWLWTGFKTRLGYGYIRGGRKSPPMIASRVSFRLYVTDPIPSGLFVCHKCDNPSCVNPDHLFLGTAKDNTRDCISKGRFKKVFALAAEKRAQTHCVHGHEFTPENTYVYKTGFRQCRACHKLAKASWHNENRKT